MQRNQLQPAAAAAVHLLLLLVLAALLLVTPTAPAAAAAVDTYYSGRVVIAGTARTARRLEDEVAPELSSWAAGLSGRGNGGHVSTAALDANRPVCPHEGSCAGDSGKPYIGRPCSKVYHCG